jgi:hypothetical protein
MAMGIAMKSLLLAVLIGISASIPATADDNDEYFNAAEAIEGFFAAGKGCYGTETEEYKRDEVAVDRRCAETNAWAMMLEAHGYCFDEEKQEWALCAASQ